jgi:hypothetical protein
MSDQEIQSEPTTWPGGCLCGAITFRVELPVTACVHCHCTMCQRSHGAGHVTWIALPSDQFSIDEGEDLLVRYASSEHGSRSFCQKCGSALLCQIDERPDEIDIPLANLAPGSGIQPQAHIYVDDRARWTIIDDELPQLGGKTGLEPTND